MYTPDSVSLARQLQQIFVPVCVSGRICIDVGMCQCVVYQSRVVGHVKHG